MKKIQLTKFQVQCYENRRKTNLSSIKQSTKFTLLFIIILVIIYPAVALGQAASLFNYQAVLRNESGTIKANTPASVKLTILQGSSSGTAKYNETHSAVTNSLGLINLQVGSKNTTQFNTIDWSDGPYFLKVEVDGADMGTTQLLSVPFARYADNAARVNADGIDEGTLSVDRYSAYADLEEEGILDNNDNNDILTRSKADARYIPNLSFCAKNDVSDNYTSHEVKVEFNNLLSGTDIFYLDNQDRYLAFFHGFYNFSATVALSNLTTDASVAIVLTVNGSEQSYRLVSCISGATAITLSGSVTIELNIGDYVEISAVSSDANFTVVGDNTLNVTHFSGHLVNRIF